MDKTQKTLEDYIKESNKSKDKSFGEDSMWVVLLFMVLFFGNKPFFSDKEIADIDKRLSKVEGQIDILKERK